MATKRLEITQGSLSKDQFFKLIECCFERTLEQGVEAIEIRFDLAPKYDNWRRWR